MTTLVHHGRIARLRPGLRLFFGDGPLASATADDERRLALWRAWEPVSVAAHGHR